MKKATAHLILGFFDLAALFACYYTVSLWRSIGLQVDIGAEKIAFQNYFGMYGLLVIIPLIHILSFFKWQGAVKVWLNRLLVAVFLLLMVAIVGLNSYLGDKLTTAGYNYCAQQSEMMTFSEFKTFLRNDLPCSE